MKIWFRAHRSRASAAVLALVALVATSCIEPPPPPTSTTTTTTTTTVAPTNVDSVETSGGTVTATVASGVAVDIAVADLSALPPVPSNVATPVGALSIHVNGLVAGSAVTVVVELETPVDRAKKLIDGEWQRFDHDGTTGVSVSPDGLTLTLDLLDGGRGDADGAANGVIVDPVLPEEVTAVEITTEATPLISQAVPYLLQLEADGPDAGAITWSVISGGVYNMSLSADGLISGTLPGYHHGVYPGFMRVQATDGETTDTKLLLFSSHPISPILGVPTGTPLPSGTAIDYLDGPIGGAYAPPQRTYRADGTVVDPVAMDVETASRAGNRHVSPDATMVLVRWSDPNQQPTVSGPPTVVDADTGATIAELADPPAFGNWSTEWSPDGAFLALVGDTGGGLDGAIYETAGWTVVRELVNFGDGQLRWSADSSRVFTTGSTDPSGPPTAVEILEAPDFTSGATLTLPAAGCQAEDLSVQGQLVATCSAPTPTLLTMSAVDGSGVTEVFSGCNSADVVLPCFYSPRYPRFSPDGEHLLWTGFIVTSVSPFVIEAVLAVQGATGGSAATPIVVAPADSGSQGFYFARWR